MEGYKLDKDGKPIRVDDLNEATVVVVDRPTHTRLYPGGRGSIGLNMSALAFAAQMMPYAAVDWAEPPKQKSTRIPSKPIDPEWMKKRKKLLAKLRLR
jgi:hypothetical protein